MTFGAKTLRPANRRADRNPKSSGRRPRRRPASHSSRHARPQIPRIWCRHIAPQRHVASPLSPIPRQTKVFSFRINLFGNRSNLSIGELAIPFQGLRCEPFACAEPLAQIFGHRDARRVDRGSSIDFREKARQFGLCCLLGPFERHSLMSSRPLPAAGPRGTARGARGCDKGQCSARRCG